MRILYRLVMLLYITGISVFALAEGKKYEILFAQSLYTPLLLLLILAVVSLYRANRRELRRRIKAQTKLLLQKNLVDQRNEFDNVFHSIREGLITYDKHYRIRFVNRAALLMLNMSYSQERPYYEGLSAGTYLSIFHNGEEILYQLLEKVYNSGKSVSVPNNSFMKELGTNSYFPVSGEFVPLFNKNSITGFALSFRNISEEELQKTLFHLAVEDNSIYPWQYDVDKDVFLFPLGFLLRFGFDESKKYIMREQIGKMIHPDFTQKVKNDFRSVVDGEKASVRLNFRAYDINGELEWWECRMSIFPGLNSNDPYSILGVCQNIQRYKKTETELILARDKALESDKLKTAFLANISHEIRTPLNLIVGFSDLLKDIHSFEEEDVTSFVATINNNCELLLNLINDILDMSLIESGTMQFRLSGTNLSLLIDDLYLSQRLNISKRVAFIKIVPEGASMIIQTDVYRLKQLLSNLLHNAIKFTSSGSISFGYSLEEPGFVTLFVEDTGVGISKEDQEHIFDRFYKVNSFSQGAGLGLSLCWIIVERMNGTIAVNSEVGKGTCFTIRIPDNLNKC
ncbi:PAS domain-containing sensor histidine kinase [uncultured Bacteroides sp.]|uniref:sensor histidine kinase n=1 Tax=uncultured Bacteroides sp. TaxID=162156 RepID=UPI002AAAFEFD|nr:PAS domain-containing sensor histidine kinase [uncultured Bacteroides sp.]